VSSGDGSLPSKEITVKIFQNGVFHITGVLDEKYDRHVVSHLHEQILATCPGAITGEWNCVRRVVLMNYKTKLTGITNLSRETLHARVRQKGFKTNYDFSQKFVFNTYLAYGINDKRFKYQLGFDYILDDKMWTKFSMNYRDDYDLLGISNSPISSISTGGIFQFFNFFSGNARMNSTQELKVDYTKSFKKYFSCNVSFINASFNPVGRFAFAYLADPVKGMVSENISDRFVNSSFGLEVRWAYREKMISRGHD
jgi:hypothetical protein